MTYPEFLSACRRIARIESKSEFARMLNVKPTWYIQAENGKRTPGRELLDNAARLAGFKNGLEDCLTIHAPIPVLSDEAKCIDVLRRVWRVSDAKTQVLIASFLSSLSSVGKKRTKRH